MLFSRRPSGMGAQVSHDAGDDACPQRTRAVHLRARGAGDARERTITPGAHVLGLRGTLLSAILLSTFRDPALYTSTHGYLRLHTGEGLDLKYT